MVKCAECGYLTFRHRDSRGLVEVEENTRECGASPSIPNRGFKMYAGSPLCFMMASELQEELTEDKDDPGAPGVLQVIQKGRSCAAFTPWQRGFTPKEHREFEMNEEERRRQETSLERQQEFQRELLDIQSKRQKALVVVASIFTLLGALIGALATSFSQGLAT